MKSNTLKKKKIHHINSIDLTLLCGSKTERFWRTFFIIQYRIYLLLLVFAEAFLNEMIVKCKRPRKKNYDDIVVRVGFSRSRCFRQFGVQDVYQGPTLVEEGTRIGQRMSNCNTGQTNMGSNGTCITFQSCPTLGENVPGSGFTSPPCFATDVDCTRKGRALSWVEL